RQGRMHLESIPLLFPAVHTDIQIIIYKRSVMGVMQLLFVFSDKGRRLIHLFRLVLYEDLPVPESAVAENGKDKGAVFLSRPAVSRFLRIPLCSVRPYFVPVRHKTVRLIHLLCEKAVLLRQL